MNCPYCQHNCSPSARACPNCGHQLVEHKSNAWWIILLILLPIVGMFMFLFFLF